MDDLKLFEESKTALTGTLKAVEGVSEAMGMQFGLRKCSEAHVIRGKVIDGDEVRLNSGGTLKPEGKQGSYKYLGVNQLLGANLNQKRVLQAPEENVELGSERCQQDEG